MCWFLELCAVLRKGRCYSLGCSGSLTRAGSHLVSSGGVGRDGAEHQLERRRQEKSGDEPTGGRGVQEVLSPSSSCYSSPSSPSSTLGLLWQNLSSPLSAWTPLASPPPLPPSSLGVSVFHTFTPQNSIMALSFFSLPPSLPFLCNKPQPDGLSYHVSDLLGSLMKVL